MPSQLRPTHENVAVAMRDGVTLICDIYLPEATGTFPTLLARQPYAPLGGPSPDFWLEHGYAYVFQDNRGRNRSEGEFYPFRDDPADTYDTVEWAATQPWCDGNLGLLYNGGYQFQSALHSPPHLKAVVSAHAPSDLRRSWVYTGGAFLLGWMVSHANHTGRSIAERIGGPEYVAKLDEYLIRPYSALQPLLEEWYRHQPLTDLGEAYREVAPQLADYLAHPDDDEYWRSMSCLPHLERMDIAVYHIEGWYDHSTSGTLDNFVGMRERGMSEEARRKQKLLMGPWAHWTDWDNPTTGGSGPNIDFGPEAATNGLDEHIRWFDYWLKGINTGVMDEPPIRLFVMGENKWRTEHEWPLARTRYTPYYLHSNGNANTDEGDGTLSLEAPAPEPPDRYVYDPDDPAPSMGGNAIVMRMGVFDQRRVEHRPDVLCYTSPPLTEDLEVTGPVSCTLYATSSAVDTDFTAKLVDVRPDGFVQNLCDGIIRARYRDSESSPTLIKPGQVYQYTIDMWATSYVFESEHQIRVEVSSSNFPRFDRNPNTGRTIATETTLLKASQTILHDAQHPSHVTLPVIPR